MDTDNKDPSLHPSESEKPEVFSISRDERSVRFSRREFIELAGVATAGVALTSGIALGNPNVVMAATCTVRTDKDVVGVHVGPGRNRGIRSYLPKDKDIPVIGKANDRKGNLWWQIQLPKIEQAWVADEDVETSGDCNSIGAQATPVIKTAVPDKSKPTATPKAAPVQGTVPPGQTGINYTQNGTTYTLPCGSTIPKNAVCICNCVSEPAPTCSCDSVCSCQGVCSCAGAGHYWYPN